MSDLIANEFLKYRRIIAALLRKARPAASTQDIEDILQDTYINTYRSSLKQEIKFPKAFMVTTAIRLANRTLAKAQRFECETGIDDFSDEALYIDRGTDYSSFTERKVLQREDFGFLCDAINQLPPQCRRVFILKKIYGLTQKEIAQELGLSQSTVEKHIAKGLLRTKEYFEQAKLEAITDSTEVKVPRKIKSKVRN